MSHRSNADGNGDARLWGAGGKRLVRLKAVWEGSYVYLNVLKQLK